MRLRSRPNPIEPAAPATPPQGAHPPYALRQIAPRPAEVAEATGAKAYVERTTEQATPRQATKLLCPRRNGLAPAFLRAQARALPPAQKLLLRQAALRLGDEAHECIERWLQPSPAPEPAGVHALRATHYLVAAALYGGPRTLAELAHGDECAGPLAARAVRQWAALPPETKRTLASDVPGDHELVATLDALFTGSISVRRRDFRTTLRLILLALSNAGAAGLDWTLRAMAGTGDVRLLLQDKGRHRTTLLRSPSGRPAMSSPASTAAFAQPVTLAPAHKSPSSPRPFLPVAPPSPPPQIERPSSYERSSALLPKLGPHASEDRSSFSLSEEAIAAARSLMHLGYAQPS